jgi:2-alkenal reductase
MKNRKILIAAVAVLLLALLFGAGLARWGDTGSSWAVTAQPQRPQLVSNEPAPVSQEQAALAAIMPTQEVLAALYDQVAPSVVNIQVTVKPEVTASPGSPSPFPFGLPELPENQAPLQGEGSGFIYDADGHIVTNNHVVEGAEEIVVYFGNGMWAEAELVAADPQADLAVIKVTPPEGMEWRPLPLASPNSLRAGYYVAAMGSPFGLNETMTVGVVSALGRSFATGDGTEGATYSLPDVIQTDTAINPGNSGGPLLNLNGEVVGVNFAINSPVRANSGVGFAIPVSVVQKVVPALIQEGLYTYSYLGIAGGTINEPLAEENDLLDNTLGVWVSQVVEGGPAAEAGLQEGDIIVSIDGQPVTRFEDLISYLFQSTEPDQAVRLGVMRDGELTNLDVTLAARPGATEQAQEQGTPEATISISQAIQAAREAVVDAGLIEQIDSANAQQDTQNGRPVWIVTLTGNGQTATVVVDGLTGEVLGLETR